jgi:hypothetical protein
VPVGRLAATLVCIACFTDMNCEWRQQVQGERAALHDVSCKLGMRVERPMEHRHDMYCVLRGNATAWCIAGGLP